MVPQGAAATRLKTTGLVFVIAFVLVQPIHSFQVKTPVGLWQSVHEQLLDNIFERSFSFYSFLA